MVNDDSMFLADVLIEDGIIKYGNVLKHNKCSGVLITDSYTYPVPILVRSEKFDIGMYRISKSISDHTFIVRTSKGFD